jgi:hypothetical protein
VKKCAREVDKSTLQEMQPGVICLITLKCFITTNSVVGVVNSLNSLTIRTPCKPNKQLGENVEMSSFIALFSEMPNHASAIICTSILANLSVQVGVPPGVESEYGHFEVVRGWV